jgi:AraC-like DNA-binding protein
MRLTRASSAHAPVAPVFSWLVLSKAIVIWPSKIAQLEASTSARMCVPDFRGLLLACGAPQKPFSAPRPGTLSVLTCDDPGLEARVRSSRLVSCTSRKSDTFVVTEALFQPFPMLPGRRAQAWRHHPAYQRPRHFHEEPELNLVGGGSATLGVGERIIRVTRGDILLFHPGQDHVLLSASEDLALFAVALNPELAARSCAELAHAASEGCRLSEFETAHAQDLLRAMSTTVASADVEGQLADLFRSVRLRANSTHVLSRLALEHVKADPTLSGTELTTLLRADPSALSRHFHSDLSVRFVEYRARRRLMAFVRFADSGAGLSRAAVDAGFGSYAQCHRVFTRLIGCAPRRYFDGKRREIDETCCARSNASSTRR